MEGDKLAEEKLKKNKLCQKLNQTTKSCVFSKKKQIQETQKAKLRKSMEEKERKEKFQAEEREKLLKELNEYGGLWDDAEIEEEVAAFSTEKDKKFVLKVQLC